MRYRRHIMNRLRESITKTLREEVANIGDVGWHELVEVLRGDDLGSDSIDELASEMLGLTWDDDEEPKEQPGDELPQRKETGPETSDASPARGASGFGPDGNGPDLDDHGTSARGED